MWYKQNLGVKAKSAARHSYKAFGLCEVSVDVNNRLLNSGNPPSFSDYAIMIHVSINIQRHDEP